MGNNVRSFNSSLVPYRSAGDQEMMMGPANPQWADCS